ncbi:TFIIIC subunit 5 family protein [Sporobolomyces salmoneus]|uniref:TFIIIC subunit 5 family protein n=1 Tax=Sporobolomyces salmoneus TaxID=183962 RepID=UPI0031719BB9
MQGMELPIPPGYMSSDAPTHALSPALKSTSFTSIEYPSPISLSTTSLSVALSSISPGLDKIAKARMIELDLGHKNPYFHKIPATCLEGNNIVLKVTKRRRKVPKRDQEGNVIEEGEYRIEPIGVESKLVRFRAMADFQYVPKLEKSDPVINLADGIRNLDIQAIKNFKMPEPTQDFSSPSNFLPPPVFSRHALPQNFDFRPSGGAVRMTDPTTGLTRLVNSTRYKVKTIQSILFVDERVPQGPDAAFLKELGRTELNELEEKVRELLEERPVWTRLALVNQLNKDQVKYVTNNKSVWPMIGYTFSDGPFRDLIVRFGYDPRKDPQARFYQHFVLRNISNVRSKALPGSKSASQATSAAARHSSTYRGGQIVNEGGPAGGAAASQQEEGGASSNSKSHIFDGVQVYSKIGNFQLVDISDPLSRALIDSPDGVLSSCSSDANEGWYSFDYLDQIKQVVRRKFMSLVLEGKRLEDKDCDDLLGWEMRKGSRLDDTTGGSRPAAPRREKSRTRRKGKERASSDEESSAVSTAEEQSGQDDDDESSGGTGSGTDSVGTGGEGSGSDQGTKALKARGPRRSRAPWELPRKKKRRPKEMAETEEDMLARLQRKTRRSTTTGFGVGSSAMGRRESTGSNEGEQEEEEE